MNRTNRISPLLTATLLWLLAATCAAAPQTGFDTPEQAVEATRALIGASDPASVEAVFGAGSYEMFDSGDPEANREDFQRVKQMIEEKVAFEDFDATTRVALFGAKAWPWPIPLVQREGKWYFDTEAGRQELLNRRVGVNELWTLTALREVVSAQQEYRSEGRDGKPPAYARVFRSSEGQHDGLYWATAEHEAESPLGDLLAESDVRVAGDPRPFHGYHYRMLESQGPSAPGGERSYLDAQGLMSGGFAVIAWPAKYGNSGVMSFQVNHQGIVFQKDLGEGTAAVAAKISQFGPDASWDPTADSISEDDTE